jgi:uncharacterized protein YggU (UPF0235/DUF167 family)
LGPAREIEGFTCGKARCGAHNHAMDTGRRQLERLYASARFAVRLMPRGGADRVDGVSDDGVLQARVSAPAVGGAANAALLRLLAEELDVSRSSVRLVAGATGRQKLIVVDGISPQGVADRWPGIKV